MPGKVKSHLLPEAERIQILKEFYSISSSLNNASAAEKFFNDLLTPSELVMISRRIQLAKMLLAGATHEEIKDELKVGFSTISHVERWLNNGFGGYKAALKNGVSVIVKTKKAHVDEMPNSLDWIRKKYPAQFMLINLLLNKK